MTRKRLLELIEKGEGLKVEFKQRFSTHEKIAKEMIAFANTRGGVILFGIDDDGSIYGVESEKGESELISESAKKYCEPPVEYEIFYHEIEHKEIVAVSIGESDTKPHRIQDYFTHLDLNNAQVYVRVNDKSVLAGKEMTKLLQIRFEGKALYKYEIGKNEKIVFDFLAKHEKITAKELEKTANISNRRASRTLIKLVRANMLVIHTNDKGENYFTSAGGID